jgi:hypothetical protein
MSHPPQATQCFSGAPLRAAAAAPTLVWAPPLAAGRAPVAPQTQHTSAHTINESTTQTTRASRGLPSHTHTHLLMRTPPPHGHFFRVRADDSTHPPMSHYDGRRQQAGTRAAPRAAATAPRVRCPRACTPPPRHRANPTHRTNRNADSPGKAASVGAAGSASARNQPHTRRAHTTRVAVGRCEHHAPFNGARACIRAGRATRIPGTSRATRPDTTRRQ